MVSSSDHPVTPLFLQHRPPSIFVSSADYHHTIEFVYAESLHHCIGDEGLPSGTSDEFCIRNFSASVIRCELSNLLHM